LGSVRANRHLSGDVRKPESPAVGDLEVNPPAVAPGPDDARVLENRQVARDDRGVKPKGRRNLADAALARTQQFHDLQAMLGSHRGHDLGHPGIR
jgi:hypothetical protein